MKLHLLKLATFKKYLSFLFVIAIIMSCDSDDNNSDDEELTPPLWIIGNWEGDKSGSLESPSYPIFEFTTDNFIGKNWEEFNSPPFNFNRVISKSGFKYEVEELSTDDSYEIIVELGTVPTSYKFVKENDTTIILHYSFNKELLDPEPPYKLYKAE